MSKDIKISKYNFELILLDKELNVIQDLKFKNKIQSAIDILTWNTTIKSEMFLSIKANNKIFNVKDFCINIDKKVIELTFKEI